MFNCHFLVESHNKTANVFVFLIALEPNKNKLKWCPFVSSINWTGIDNSDWTQA